MNDPKSSSTDVEATFDALRVIDVPCIVVTIVDARIVFANDAARIDVDASCGRTILETKLCMHVDDATRAQLFTTLHEGRAGAWRWPLDHDAMRRTTVRPLPTREPRPRMAVVSWSREPRAAGADDSLQRFRAVFEQALDPLLLAADSGHYVDANPAACMAFGYSAEEFRRLHIRDLLAPAAQDRWQPAWAAFLQRTRDEGRTVLRTRDGSERVFEYRAVAHIQPGLHLSALRDVTDLARTTASLVEREQQFRSLADHVPDPTFVLGLEGPDAGRILYLNGAAEVAYGYRRDELLGRSLIEVLDGDETAARSSERLAELRAGRPITFQGTHRRKDGTEIVIEARATRFTWEGRPAALAIDRDITEYRRATEAAATAAAHAAEQQRLLEWLVRAHLDPTTFPTIVRELTERLATRYGCERVSVWLFEPNGDLRCVDAHTRTGNRHTHGDVMPLHGYAAELRHLRESRYVDASDPYHDPRTAGYVDSYLRPNGITSMLDAAIFYGGRGYGTLCLEHVGRSHTWSRDEIEFACTIASQLSIAVASEARAAAEAATRERERFLTAILEGSPIGIQIFDPDGTPRRANAAQSRLLGGQSVRNALSDATARADGTADAFTRCKSGHPTSLERRRSPDSATRDVDQMFFPVFDQHGTVASIVQFTWDVGDRVAAERTHKQLETQLREAQKLEAVGLLAGGVAHDFNNILTAVLGFAGVLSDGIPRTDPQHELVEQILKAAERGAALTRQLLAFGRKQVVRAEVFDPAAIVREIEPMLRRLLEANVRLLVEAPASGCIHVDRNQFEQVLLNLVVNARDAMPDGGELRIEVGPGRTFDGHAAVTVRVRDDGVGMSAEVKARAFEPFFTTKEKGKGTGLGLATVYGIVVQSGGSISLDTAPGTGSVFELTWPLVAATAIATPPTPSPSPLPLQTEILLVEDDEPNRELAARILRRHGHTVTAAANGEQALDLAARDPHLQLLVTDVVMPGIGGRELAERLRRQRPCLRVLFVSGYLADEAVRLDLDDRHVALLQKPYSADELNAAIDRLLRG